MLNIETYQSYFGEFTDHTKNLKVFTVGYDYAREVILIVNLLDQLRSDNLISLCQQDRVGLYYKYLPLFLLSKRKPCYEREYPFHKLSIYLDPFFETFKNLSEIEQQEVKKINTLIDEVGRFSLFYSLEEPEKFKTLMFKEIGQINESILEILNKLQVKLQTEDFKKVLLSQQKYLSKLKKSYTTYVKDILLNHEYAVQFDLYITLQGYVTENFAIPKVSQQTIEEQLDAMLKDREFLYEEIKNIFGKSLLGYMWKLDHNSTLGFFLRYKVWVKSAKTTFKKNFKKFQQISVTNIRNGGCYQVFDKYMLGGQSVSKPLNQDDYLWREVNELVVSDTIFKLELPNGGRTIGKGVFKIFKKIESLEVIEASNFSFV